MKKIILLLSILFFLLSCSRKDRIYIYNPDKKQCITIFNRNEIRYIANGKQEKIPDTNYLKLDVSKIDPLGDGIWICWENNEYKWDIVVDKSVIIESRIDSSQYRFSTNLPVDERGIPTEIKFRGDNCAIFDFYSMTLSPNKGAIIEIE